jgi:hypothetical protein
MKSGLHRRHGPGRRGCGPLSHHSSLKMKTSPRRSRHPNGISSHGRLRMKKRCPHHHPCCHSHPGPRRKKNGPCRCRHPVVSPSMVRRGWRLVPSVSITPVALPPLSPPRTIFTAWKPYSFAASSIETGKWQDTCRGSRCLLTLFCGHTHVTGLILGLFETSIWVMPTDSDLSAPARPTDSSHWLNFGHIWEASAPLFIWSFYRWTIQKVTSYMWTIQNF